MSREWPQYGGHDELHGDQLRAMADLLAALEEISQYQEETYGQLGVRLCFDDLPVVGVMGAHLGHVIRADVGGYRLAFQPLDAS